MPFGASEVGAASHHHHRVEPIAHPLHKVLFSLLELRFHPFGQLAFPLKLVDFLVVPPFIIKQLFRFLKKHFLRLIEDSHDSLGLHLSILPLMLMLIRVPEKCLSFEAAIDFLVSGCRGHVKNLIIVSPEIPFNVAICLLVRILCLTLELLEPAFLLRRPIFNIFGQTLNRRLKLIPGIVKLFHFKVNIALELKRLIVVLNIAQGPITKLQALQFVLK